MKLGKIFGAVTLVAVTAFVTTQVISQDGKTQPAGHKEGKTTATPAGPDAEIMKKIMEAATPGEPHKMLAKRIGKWTYTMESRMDPNAPAETCTGTSDIEAAIGGRFIIQRVKAETKMGPFEGMGISGYDNVSKKYVDTWMDNCGTGIMLSQGTADAAGKVITSTGECSCPIAQGPQKFRFVTTWVDDTHMNMLGYSNDKDGKEYKCMEIKYTRAATK